jgi:hypothetical protein
MTPNEVTRARHTEVFQNLFGYKHVIKKGEMYNIGDFVRVTKARNVFTKSYIAQWTTEIFVIRAVSHTSPITYKLKSQTEEPIKGSYYKAELQKVQNKEFFEIDKILDKRIKNGKKEILVSWVGYPDTENMWIPSSNTKRIK